MTRENSNQIGDFGELLAATDLSRSVKAGYKRPLFKPTHLGQKYPSVDFIVDLVGTDGSSGGFFFAQVKSTSKGKKSSKRLPVRVPLKKYNRLASIPAPTFLIGVDTYRERTYLVAAPKPIRRELSSITKAFDLKDDQIKIALYKEVIYFWRKHRAFLQRTRFTNGKR